MFWLCVEGGGSPKGGWGGSVTKTRVLLDFSLSVRSGGRATLNKESISGRLGFVPTPSVGVLGSPKNSCDASSCGGKPWRF